MLLMRTALLLISACGLVFAQAPATVKVDGGLLQGTYHLYQSRSRRAARSCPSSDRLVPRSRHRAKLVNLWHYSQKPRAPSTPGVAQQGQPATGADAWLHHLFIKYPPRGAGGVPPPVDYCGECRAVTVGDAITPMQNPAPKATTGMSPRHPGSTAAARLEDASTLRAALSNRRF
jgi:hypothetical protein